MGDAYAEALVKHYEGIEAARRTLGAAGRCALPHLWCSRCGVVAIDPKKKTISDLRIAMSHRGWHHEMLNRDAQWAPVAEDWCRNCADAEYRKRLKERREAEEMCDGC